MDSPIGVVGAEATPSERRGRRTGTGCTSDELRLWLRAVAAAAAEEVVASDGWWRRRDEQTGRGARDAPRASATELLIVRWCANRPAGADSIDAALSMSASLSASVSCSTPSTASQETSDRL